MKEKKQDRYFRDTFRNKLENVEVTPGPEVFGSMMRKLAVREFLHFTPFRFNVYYLSGIIAAAALSVAILSGGKNGADQKAEKLSVAKLNMNDSVDIEKRGPEVKDSRLTNIGMIDQSGLTKRTEPKSVQVSPKSKNIKIRQQILDHESTTATMKETLRSKDLFSTRKGGTDDLIPVTSGRGSIMVLSSSSGCAPLKIHFGLKNVSADSCTWTFSDGGTSSEKEPDWIYDLDGVYRVSLRLFMSDGRIEADTSVITVYPKPAARFEINPEKNSIAPDEVSFRNYSAGGVKFAWTFGDGDVSDLFEPVHKYYGYGKYNVTLKVSSEEGCTDSMVVYNALSGSSCFIQFPNAFIPNEGGASGGVYSTKSDESAQVFHPSSSGVAEYHLKIFSKLGVLIFESDDINIGWDGYYNGQLSNPGVYIWKVRGNFITGEPFTRMGDVTLLKN